VSVTLRLSQTQSLRVSVVFRAVPLTLKDLTAKFENEYTTVINNSMTIFGNMVTDDAYKSTR